MAVVGVSLLVDAEVSALDLVFIVVVGEGVLHQDRAFELAVVLRRGRLEDLLLPAQFEAALVG